MASEPPLELKKPKWLLGATPYLNDSSLRAPYFSQEHEVWLLTIGMHEPDFLTPSSTVSVGSGTSSRELLFGEIESIAGKTADSSRSNTSTCNLTLSSNSTFLKFWLCDSARDAFLSHTSRQDLTNLRLVCHDFSNRIAPTIFSNVSTTFDSKTFTRPARIAALERIGHHIQSFSLVMRHSTQTSLPPLIDPSTGEQVPFVYEPQTHSPQTLIEKVKNPKYGSWMLADLLVKQYPPLFHAATNVPSFIRAFSSMTNLTHLGVSCPGKEMSQISRRNIVDYCLISLRIAIERAALDRLRSVSLSPIHEEGLFYLQPTIGFGASPRAIKRWAQIDSLAVHLQCAKPSSGKPCNSMKILHAYLQNFRCLKRLHFRWDGYKGPCPMSLDSELKCGVNSGEEAEKTKLRRLKFGQLEYLILENAMMDATQVSTFIARHRRTLNKFSFEDVQLRNGDWDEALAPLVHAQRASKAPVAVSETMDVPVFLSPEDWKGPTSNDAKDSTARGKRGTVSLYRLWSKAKESRTSWKAKEQIMSSSEHMKKLLRCSVMGRRKDSEATNQR